MVIFVLFSILILQANYVDIIQGKKFLPDVLRTRNQLINEELNMMTGNDIVLSDSEIEANNIVMELKDKIMEDGYLHPDRPIFSKDFLEYKEDIDNSQLFKIIERMPKGGVLHAHDTAVLSPDYMLNITYWDNLYICWNYGCDLQFRFSKNKPKIYCKSEWKLIKYLREMTKNVADFDAQIRNCFTIKVENPRQVYPHINAVWTKFQNYFHCTIGLFSYAEAWKQYFYDSLLAFKNDNVMYAEIRSVLQELYDLDGNIYNAVDTAKVYKMVADKFMTDHPDFFGVKMIYAPPRFVNDAEMEKYLTNAKQVKKIMPDFFAGFDLVGQEDIGNRTKDFLPHFVNSAKDIDYFFHAGETNWFGTTDENLYDAIALNVKRIGHGYAILKHPLLLEIIKKNKIALEVNVISNQVLKLVADLRNHPLSTFLSIDLPVVISSDDPGIWEATPMSHDFFMTFIACAHAKADLRLLKKLALNSLCYSTITEKQKAVQHFEKQWEKFIFSLINDRLN